MSQTPHTISLRSLRMIRVAAVTPAVRVANVRANVDDIIRSYTAAREDKAQIVLFPELCLSGYTCADLFYESRLLDAVHDALSELAELTMQDDGVMIVGAPLRSRGQLYNCAVVIGHGSILGVVPKTYLPSYQEFYEARWFASSRDTEQTTIRIGGHDVPFGIQLLFEHRESPLATATSLCFGVEVCEDLWATTSPSTDMALAGAQLIFNLSASNEVVGKAAYRRDLVRMQSARCIAAYVYCSAGSHESSMDVVFAGHNIIAEQGELLAQSERFSFEPQITLADIDIESLDNDRIRNTTFRAELSSRPFERVPVFLHDAEVQSLLRHVDRSPFMRGDESACDVACSEILQLQSTALQQRLMHLSLPKVVIGVSGGLDSTLALFVCKHAMEKLGLPTSHIVAVSMPGLGTGSRSRAQAQALAGHVGADFREIDISDAAMMHFRDIGHDDRVHDVVYENAQARERTQILMDIANAVNGIVIGTGDMSEIALGWNTYNGDHMSMYGINSGVPKTVVRRMVRWIASLQDDDALRALLLAIVEQPITPELLPLSDTGELVQKTEDAIGPYALHDFVLFTMLRHHFNPRKIFVLASQAFRGELAEVDIARHMKVFYRRFFAQQYKRSAMPDGPKVMSVALSPRGDWRMPSDAAADSWLADLPV